jgi:hypothetical protein
MKYIVIITRATGEFDTFWSFNNGDFYELNNESSNQKLLIWHKDDESSFPAYKDKIVSEINNDTSIELGVIFHKLNGDIEAAALRRSLTTSFNGKLSFCQWYSGNTTDFWNEGNHNDNKPYNNLKKAWRNNNGSNKEDAFNAVWEYFSKKNDNNQKLETNLEFLHNCLTPDGLKDATLQEDWQASSEFEELKKENGNNPFSDPYIDALTALRNKLLPA